MDARIELYKSMTFESKDANIHAIKKFHFLHSFNYDVKEDKGDKYVTKCIQYGNGCQWRVRESFSKIQKRWEIKKLNGIHTCTCSLIS